MKEKLTIKQLINDGFKKDDAKKIIGLSGRYDCVLYYRETKEVKFTIMNFMWDTTAHQGGVIKLNPRTGKAQWTDIYYGRGLRLKHEPHRRDI